MQGSESLEPTYYEYKIKNGDSLSLIMLKMFGVGSQSSKYQTTIKYLLALNPHINNPNLIRAGNVLRLGAILSTPATK
ncbi:MAG: LysM repeat protein [Lentisphaeria bacterium]|jgi:LysM repeat protein